MVEADLGELVLLHLETGEPYRDERIVPRDLAVPGIADALALGAESVADRVTLLSTLEDLQSDDLVREDDRIVRGLSGIRNVYFLTEAGRDRADRLRDRFRDRTIEVRENGDTEEVPLSEADRFAEEPALPRVLARTTGDGVLYLGEERGDRFVDREDALAALEDALAAVDDGHPRSALVAGEAGIGKTTLATERLPEEVDDRATMLIGRCQRDTAEPYAPFRAALSDYLADAHDPFEPKGTGPEGAEAYEAERAAMFKEIAAFVDDVAESEGSLILVIDDLQSADDPTVDLFTALSEWLSGPVLLVGTYRPEDLPPEDPLSRLLKSWEREDRALIELDPLEPADVRQLLRWVLDARDVPTEFVEFVVDRTGGNPLFVKELVARLRREGAIDPEHGVYPEDDIDVGLPDRVDEAVGHRLSVLDDATREVLNVGALIGESIPLETLRASLLGFEETALHERVDVLVGARIWERADEDRLRFVSGLVRETVVDRIGDERRQSLHARIAGGVEATHGDDPDHHAVAAYHRRRAGDDERAFEHYCSAADRAKDVYAHEVALEHYQRAYELATEELNLPEDDERVVTVLERLAEVFYLLGEYEQADRYYQFVQERTDDPEQGRRIARIRADMLDSQGQYERALEICENAVAKYGIEDTHESAILLGRYGTGYMHTGDLESAEEYYDQVLEIGRQIDDPEAIAAGLLDIGALEMMLGDIDEGTVERLEEAVEQAERSGEDRVLSRAVNNLAMAHMELGDLDRAEETYDRVLEIHERMGDVVRLAESRRNLGAIYRRRGDHDAAIETFEAALEHAESARNPNVMASIHASIADIHHARGDLDAALERREEAYDLFERVGNDPQLAHVEAFLADLYLDRGEIEAAERTADAAMERVEGIDMPEVVALATVVDGDVARIRDDFDTAVDRYETALEYDAKGETAGAGSVAVFAHAALADLHIERGDADEALAAAETAMEHARDLDSPALVAAANRAIGACRRELGDYEAAERALTGALETTREPATRSALTEVRVLLELGRLDRDRGNRDRARDHARAALDLATDCGIGRYADDCRELAEQLDVETGAVVAGEDVDGD